MVLAAGNGKGAGQSGATVGLTGGETQAVAGAGYTDAVSGSAANGQVDTFSSGPALWPSGEDFEALRFSELNPDLLVTDDSGHLAFEHPGGERGSLDTLRLAAGLLSDGVADPAYPALPEGDLFLELVPSWGDLSIMNAPEPAMIPIVLVAGVVCAVALRKRAGC